MTDTTATSEMTDPDAPIEHFADAHMEEEFGHATDLLYIQVALALAVMTALEVAWPYIVDDGVVLMVPLLIVMAIKFFCIGYFFMHLKYDKPILTRVFYSGLALAVSVYVVALATFELFFEG
jgi:cytochrome c oxidase subunit 4